ncbi:hypothetical protein BDR03DRAFT_1087474 [Suillus americanus]|nr:hypothetical protein BDR03DRAFT_1087474 [Suillus americanus]
MLSSEAPFQNHCITTVLAPAKPLSTVNSSEPVSRALFVSEIFSNIISYISADEIYVHTRNPPAFSRNTLYALALTCRTFSEQALDALWESIEGIIPLMKCGGIIVSPNSANTKLGDDHVIPTESQLAIICRYANRVRSLKLSFHDWPHSVQSFLQTVAYSSKVLMPNLRYLRATCDLVHLLRPLLGPCLQRLSINVSTSVNYRRDLEPWQRISLHMILRSLPTTCPSLESFDFNLDFSTRPGPWDAPLALPVSYAIQNLQRLRTVNVPAITKDALTYLGGLSSFTSIKTHLPACSDLEYVFGSSRGHILFENLESVDWKIAGWRDVEMFTCLWPRNIIAMSLRSEVTFNPGPLQVLFDSLHTREAFRNLQCIRLFEFSPSLSTGVFQFIEIVITIDTIRPLFYLNALRVVEFDTGSSISLNEDDLKEIAEAWPCLEVLLLNETYGCHDPKPPGVTLAGVVRFVELCPRLTKLGINFTLNDMDEDFDNLYDFESRASNTLEYLTLRSRAEEHVLTFHYSRLNMLVKKLFPRAKCRCQLISVDWFESLYA